MTVQELAQLLHQLSWSYKQKDVIKQTSTNKTSHFIISKMEPLILYLILSFKMAALNGIFQHTKVEITVYFTDGELNTGVVVADSLPEIMLWAHLEMWLWRPSWNKTVSNYCLSFFSPPICLTFQVKLI